MVCFKILETFSQQLKSFVVVLRSFSIWLGQPIPQPIHFTTEATIVFWKLNWTSNTYGLKPKNRQAEKNKENKNKKIDSMKKSRTTPKQTKKW